MAASDKSPVNTVDEDKLLADEEQEDWTGDSGSKTMVLRQLELVKLCGTLRL